MAAEKMGHASVSVEKVDESALMGFLADYHVPRNPIPSPDTDFLCRTVPM